MNQYAPRKTASIDVDVLGVLRQMEWTQRGAQTHGAITWQLDRVLYVETNKVLEALGGKWSRKDKAHIFDHDPRLDLGLVIDAGAMEIVKDGFYATPMEIGRQMARMAELSPGADVLEPSAGLGGLIRAVLEIEPFAAVAAIEIDDRRRSSLIEQGYTVIADDFLTYHGKHDRIVQNPPFERLQDIDHVLHAWDCLTEGGVLVSVMSESAFFNEMRKAADFRAWLDEQDHEAISLPRGAFHESGTDIATRIVKVHKVQG